MHIVGDEEHYPLSPTAAYKPSTYTVSQAMAFESSVGASNVVIVQPSIYGHDNSCLLDALRVLGPGRARGVVALAPENKTFSIVRLREWHELGVRGVRLNIKSTGDLVAREDVEVELRRCADAVRPLGWIIQLYIPLNMVRALEHIIPTLGVRICIDHMGAPGLKSHLPTNLPLDPYSLEGFDSLIRLLGEGNTFVKMSAPYRLSENDDFIGHVEPIAREILRVAPKRVVFATDWPHTRFEGLDIRPWITAVINWCDGDQQLADSIFRDNAKELWT
ncbi:hypothetical protein M406DRAFT_47323 [Cryphonectria parasitica EP155]|uniref:Amidohydrolase-related domain-containing protein n=1 Tax=Cryphonectria parasitica (strain ATCC 38755 / EP155) TaxID=660469 RepID=A0A9P4XT20_CRYP1|nr:uncharacterized protein M406DRAFT_47323 [Cryphonectria parasitica EP155]KAF3760439.1 hypothetical protein M406DRAFT_47323 [Cryphonectria parasitica EP155]